MRKAYIGNSSEKNPENIRALERGSVHWHKKKAFTDKSF
jgi:hypothetical protein